VAWTAGSGAGGGNPPGQVRGPAPSQIPRRDLYGEEQRGSVGDTGAEDDSDSKQLTREVDVAHQRGRPADAGRGLRDDGLRRSPDPSGPARIDHSRAAGLVGLDQPRDLRAPGPGHAGRQPRIHQVCLGAGPLATGETAGVRAGRSHRGMPLIAGPGTSIQLCCPWVCRCPVRGPIRLSRAHLETNGSDERHIASATRDRNPA